VVAYIVDYYCITVIFNYTFKINIKYSNIILIKYTQKISLKRCKTKETDFYNVIIIYAAMVKQRAGDDLLGPFQTEPHSNSPAPILNMFYSCYVLVTFT